MSDTHDQQIEKATNAILARRHGPLGIFVTREMARGLARAALDAVASEDNEREAFRRGAIWGARNLVRKDDGSWLIPSDGIVDFFLDPEARG